MESEACEGIKDGTSLGPRPVVPLIKPGNTEGQRLWGKEKGESGEQYSSANFTWTSTAPGCRGQELRSVS